MSARLQLALPSKGRLMEQSLQAFKSAGLEVRKTGHERGYRGEIDGLEDVDVLFISASEIAWYLKTGKAHLGITGEDLIREWISDWTTRVDILKKMGFGKAEVVVAVPDCWIDVRTMGELDEIATRFRSQHGRWFRVATKYINITRRFFASKGLNDYRIVESLGATEGTPAALTSDLIVDITTTGATLSANGLRVLEDGVILETEANLIASHEAEWSPDLRQIQNEILSRIEA